MFASVAAVSPEGHEAFKKYIESFDNPQTFDQMKKGMSEAMLKFLGKASDNQNG